MKTWGVGLNVLFALPIIKPLSVGLQASTRATTALMKASKPGISAAEKATLREFAKRATHDAEAITAEYVFGYRTLSRAMASPSRFAAQVISEVSKPVALVVKNPEEVVRRSGELYAEVFKNRTEDFTGFLNGLRTKLAKSAGRDANWGFNFRRRRILEHRELLGKIDELLEAARHDGLEKVLSEKNELFSEVIEKLPRGKRDWLATFTIEGIPGLNSRLLHLKELQQSRHALLRALGKADVQKASAMNTRALVDRFRLSLLAQGAEGEARWLRVRSELQSQLRLQAPEMVDELMGNGMQLPEAALRGPEIRTLLQETEQSLRSYKSIEEFDQWLAVKRLAKKARG
jgi:hypothetical protein